MTDTAMAELGGDPGNPLARKSLVWETSQIARTLEAGPTHPMGPRVSLRVTRDGAVGLFWVQAVTSTRIESVVEHGVQLAWRAGEAILRGLGARGPRYLTALFAGAMFPASSGVLDPVAGFPAVSRGPVGGRVDEEVLEGIARELNRAIGVMAYEPDPTSDESSWW